MTKKNSTKRYFPVSNTVPFRIHPEMKITSLSSSNQHPPLPPLAPEYAFRQPKGAESTIRGGIFLWNPRNPLERNNLDVL